MKRVTDASEMKTEGTPFPELVHGSDTETSTLAGVEVPSKKDNSGRENSGGSKFLTLPTSIKSPISFSSKDKSADSLFERSKADTKEQVQENSSTTKLASDSRSEGSRSPASEEKKPQVCPTNSWFI